MLQNILVAGGKLARTNPVHCVSTGSQRRTGDIRHTFHLISARHSRFMEYTITDLHQSECESVLNARQRDKITWFQCAELVSHCKRVKSQVRKS